MSKYANVEIVEPEDLGVVLRCQDVEAADRLEDFLTERCFVFFNIRPQEACIEFYFGEASSVDKVCQLYERFLANDKQ